ncbi:Bacterial transcriptional activator domain protein [Roseovarius albus]|uniref:Bacterial transcriptional activator domain protein n=1 Tax=Roseovarius albus TaxID=1247867 RepID=A0A1X6YR18_9RHOB|nr:BTAD domain-containing putative transcriptional regulator [Roseovarius albus]SLN28172.1 Bacterial transcriptional activator domain protein [Roseovarius albus]
MALLAMIATSSSTGLRRELAAATLWSRSPEAQARTNLRQALSILRATTGENIILSKGEMLAVNRDLVSLDIDALDDKAFDLDENITGFGGPFLDGLSINEPPFEEWLATNRANYGRIVRDILFDVGNFALESDQSKRALQAADRILTLDPFEEAGMALCLKALAANDERSQVQIRFDEFECLLRSELNLEISSDLVTLKTKLLTVADEQVNKTTAISVPSILVLPFKTLSDVPEHRYFSEGLAEDVITQLSKFSTLGVLSGQANLSENATEDQLSRAVKNGADYLLTGSVRWLGERFRLSVELIEVASRSVKWAERLDRKISDLFDLQDDVSRYLVGAIPYRIEEDVAEKAEKKSAEQLQAYELMILGKRLRDTLSLEGNLEARSLLELAVKKDQGLARSHMYLSDSYVVQHWFGQLDASEKEKALYHARRAVALDRFDVHIQDHLGFALHTMGHWDAAEAQIRNALSLAKNEIESMSWCGYALLMLGRHDEAAEIIQAVAKRRTTLPPTFEWILGQLFSFQGRDAEVVSTLNGASLLNSTGLAFRAGSQARLGMLKEAQFTLAEFKDARTRDQRLSGMKVGANTIETALGEHRVLWRRKEDWEHIAQGLRLAGLPD